MSPDQYAAFRQDGPASTGREVDRYVATQEAMLKLPVGFPGLGVADSLPAVAFTNSRWTVTSRWFATRWTI